MKFNRKLVAIGLSLVMVAAMSVTAVAASSSDDTTTRIKDGIRGIFFGDKGGKFLAPGQCPDVVSELTGLTETEIQTQLKAGKTLAEIAAAKDVSQDDLIAALVKAEQARLDTAKSEGKITQEQYDNCITNLQERITKQVTETRPANPGGKGGMFRGYGQSMDVVVELTGLTETEIQTQLKAGKTLSEIAAAKDVSQDDLVTALVNAEQAKLDTAKSEGKITEEQYNKCLTNLEARITNQVTSTPPAGKGNGKGMRGPGMGRMMGAPAEVGSNPETTN